MNGSSLSQAGSLRAPEAIQVGPVHETLAELTHTQDLTSSLLLDLQARLESVLRTTPPKGDGKGIAREVGASPLHEQLKRLSDAQFSINDHIRQLMDRLTV